MGRTAPNSSTLSTNTMTTRHLSVAHRLGLSFAAIALLLFAVSAVGIWALRGTTSAMDNMYTARLQPVHQITELKHLAARVRMIQTDAAINHSAERVAALKTEYTAVSTRAKGSWAAYMGAPKDGREKPLADAAHAALVAIDQAFEATMAALVAGKPDEARSLIDTQVAKANPAFNEAVDKLLSYQVEAAASDRGQSLASAERAQWAMAATSVLAALAAALLAWSGTRRITRALGAEPEALSAAAERVAEGDLATPVEVKPGDQTSTMATLARMRAELIKVVGAVRGNADSVATGSAQIAQGNTDLSQRTEEQASALQQTAATMDQLASTVRNNADNARQASQLAGNASQVATRGGEIVGQVVGTMRHINESSRRIADINAVIDGIAFQTNILALNAAVEAARAGEQGRGFAVVAGEVRSLAQRSAEAAKEIKTLISTSVEQVDAGTTLVDQAGQTMGEIVTAIKRVTDVVAEISAASEEQSRGVNQVGQAVGQMDQATQQNAALVEQSAAAAESLKGQALALVAAVNVFRIGRDDRGAAPAAAPSASRARSANAGRASPAPRAAASATPGAARSAAPTAAPTRPEARPDATTDAAANAEDGLSSSEATAAAKAADAKSTVKNPAPLPSTAPAALAGAAGDGEWDEF